MRTCFLLSRAVRCVFGVEAVWGRDVDEVDVAARAQAGSIVIGLRIRKVPAEPLHDLRIDICRCGNAKVGIADKFWNHGEGRPAETDYADT